MNLTKAQAQYLLHKIDHAAIASDQVAAMEEMALFMRALIAAPTPAPATYRYRYIDSEALQPVLHPIIDPSDVDFYRDRPDRFEVQSLYSVPLITDEKLALP